MVFSPEAARQVRDLYQHDDDRDRPEASRRLATALESAWRNIAANPAIGLTAPRPCPQRARPGRRWLKAGRYWIAYSADDVPSIIGVFFETSDIPHRL